GVEMDGSLPYYWLWDGSSTLKLPAPTTDVDNNLGPMAINDTGWIVGAAKNGFAVYTATRWDPSGLFGNSLGSMSGLLNYASYAWAISSSASGTRVAGESQFDLWAVGLATTTAFHAFRMPPTDDVLGPQPISADADLGNGLVNETSSSGAYAINSLGEVA